MSEALYRLRPELREEERQLFAQLYGKDHLTLRDSKHREVQARYEAIGNLKKELRGLARLPPAGYAAKRAGVASDFGVDENRLDAEVDVLKQAVPRGLPLAEREQYPEILDAREIADLLTSDSEIRENYFKIIAAAVANKELVSVGISTGSELDPDLVYKDVSRRLGDLERETGALSRRVDELQYQNAVLRSRLKVLEAKPPRGRRSLSEDVPRPSIRGGRGVAYSVRRQWHAPMVHRDEFGQWLQAQDIAIPSKAKLHAWFKSTRRGPRTRITNLRRAVRHARDALISKRGVEPSFDEVFDFLAEDDPTGFVVDATDEKLVWQDTNGKHQDAARKTVANMLSKVRSAG